ncbi:MAG: hypothetical protein BWY24_00595 [Microgenomates group bacterium ADurb.Bin219]|nr:MAG: hypothetical protein BWY24_00595 [Microgenomates group bacterium ADurb.Bin219]
MIIMATMKVCWSKYQNIKSPKKENPGNLKYIFLEDDYLI